MYRAIEMIRPANMRFTHGIRHPSPKFVRGLGYSVSAVQCVEDIHLDHLSTAISGSGMDAPVNLPIASVKAFATYRNGSDRVVFGFCQRTITVR